MAGTGRQVGDAAVQVLGVRYGAGASTSGFDSATAAAAMRTAMSMRPASAGDGAGVLTGQGAGGTAGGLTGYTGSGTGALGGSAAAMLRNVRALKAAEAAASSRARKVATAVRKGRATKRAARG